MVNIGRPSRGCILCRKRRVKCDQRKPGCFKCEKVRRQCPGYLNPAKWLFIDQNGQLQSSDDSSGDSSRESFTSRTVHKPVPALSQERESQALCLFIQSFVLTEQTEGSDPAHLDFLPQLYLSSSDSSCLRAAVKAISLRHVSNIHPTSISKAHATQAYLAALQSTNTALADSDQACQDDTLTTVYLLSLHELLVPTPVQESWGYHVEGALQLLRVRGPQQLQTPRGRQLFRLLHAPILQRALRTGEEPPTESLQLVGGMQVQTPQSNWFPSLAAEFFNQVISIRARLRRLLEAQDENVAQTMCEVTALIDWGTVLCAKDTFETFADNHPRWRPYLMPLVHSKPDFVCGRSEGVYFFETLWIFGHWIRVWTSRLFLYDTLVKAIDFILISQVSMNDRGSLSADSLLATKDELLDKSLTVTTYITQSMPFAFGEIKYQGRIEWSPTDLSMSALGCMYAISALTSILDVSTITERHRIVAREGLQKIAMAKGLQRAIHQPDKVIFPSSFGATPGFAQAFQTDVGTKGRCENKHGL